MLPPGLVSSSRLRDTLVQVIEKEAAIKFQRHVSKVAKCVWVSWQAQKYIQQTLPGFFPKCFMNLPAAGHGSVHMCNQCSGHPCPQTNNPPFSPSLQFVWDQCQVLTMRRSGVGFENDLLLTWMIGAVDTDIRYLGTSWARAALVTCGPQSWILLLFQLL